ncbi:MAG: UDP-N-acetylmuramate dehydrogenase [Candidatus Omnitrophica bacterium]|nr:UDP-N-acetylmuramate dehydrogenase [Candidatus Omnitrophota bacterium]
MTLLGGLKIGLEPDESLSKHTSWRIGGNAVFMAWPKNIDELAGILDYARDQHLPICVIGRGSNMLFSDEGFFGIVINMLHFEKEYLKVDGNCVEVSAGMPNHILVQKCAELDLGGLEFLSSIPGSVGGACVQNAGFSRLKGQKNEMKHFVEEVMVLTRDGQVKKLKHEEILWNYRDTSLRQFIVLKAKLKFERKNKAEVQKEVYENYRYRSEIQDLQHPSAGSVFKNPAGAGMSSGQLIDKAGLKGFKIGDAQISERHANFFINTGHATCENMLALIQHAKGKVKEQFGVMLEEEIRYVAG